MEATEGTNAEIIAAVVARTGILKDGKCGSMCMRAKDLW
jgi:hypothetical protein